MSRIFDRDFSVHCKMLVRRRTYKKHRDRGSKRYRAKTVRNFVKRCEKAGTEDDICYNAVNDPTYNIIHRRMLRKHTLLK